MEITNHFYDPKQHTYCFETKPTSDRFKWRWGKDKIWIWNNESWREVRAAKQHDELKTKGLVYLNKQWGEKPHERQSVTNQD